MPNAGLIFSKRIGYWFCVCGWLFLSSSNFVLAQSATARNGTASISGRVTIEGKPAAGATVSATDVTGGVGNLITVSFSVGSSFQARTDAEGHYEITGLRKGQYQIKCLSDAYVQQTQSGFAPQMQRTFLLDESEQLKDIDFALVRGGVITGRVTNAEGKPLIEESVRLEMINPDAEGRAIGGYHGTDQRTDDRGVYRIFGLAPGKYRVSVGSNEAGGNSYQTGGPIPRTYYPNVTNVKNAKVIEVKAGSENENIDIHVSPDDRRYFTASGRVVDAVTGQPLVTKFGVYADPQPTESDAATQGGTRMALTEADGKFTLTHLLPGRYSLRLHAANPNWMETFAYYSEPLAFTIAAGDVSGLEFKARRGSVVSGKAVLEDTANADASSLMQIRLTLHTMGAVPAGSNYYHQFTKLQPDHTFKFEGVPPGRLLLTSQRMGVMGSAPGTLTLLRVEQDSVPQNAGFTVAANENVTNLKLVFAAGTGSIRGTVQYVNGTLPQGYRVWVSARRKGDQMQGAGEADDKGRFVIESLLAGEYFLTITAYHDNRAQFRELTQRIKESVFVTAQQPAQVTLTFDLKAKERQ